MPKSTPSQMPAGQVLAFDLETQLSILQGSESLTMSAWQDLVKAVVVPSVPSVSDILSTPPPAELDDFAFGDEEFYANEGDHMGMNAFPACCGIDYNHKSPSSDSSKFCHYMDDDEESVGLTLAYGKPADDVNKEVWNNVIGTKLWWSQFPDELDVEEPNTPEREKRGDLEARSQIWAGLFVEPIYPNISVICSFPYVNAQIMSDLNWKMPPRPIGLSGSKYYQWYQEQADLRPRWWTIWDIDTALKQTLAKDTCKGKHILVDLANGQIRISHDVLIANGFEQIVEFINPKHSTPNRLYIKRTVD